MEEVLPFSVEHNEDHSTVIILDRSGKDEDVEITFDDDGYVWFRQITENDEYVGLICMHEEMFKDLLAAIDCEPGVYFRDDITRNA